MRASKWEVSECAEVRQRDLHSNLLARLTCPLGKGSLLTNLTSLPPGVSSVYCHAWKLRAREAGPAAAVALPGSVATEGRIAEEAREARSV